RQGRAGDRRAAPDPADRRHADAHIDDADPHRGPTGGRKRSSTGPARVLRQHPPDGGKTGAPRRAERQEPDDQTRQEDAKPEGTTMKRLVTILWLLAAAPVAAQTPAAAPQGESAFHAELRREGNRVRESCSAVTFKKISDCAIEL